MIPHAQAAPPAAVVEQHVTNDASAAGRARPAASSSEAPVVGAPPASGAVGDATRGGAIGGVEVVDSSPAVTTTLPPSTDVVGLAGTPHATAAGSAGPATVVGPSGSAASGNASTNSATVTQSPEVTVVNQRPIVIVGASGNTTIDVVLGGVVNTTVTATATNTSDGSAAVTTGVQTQTTAAVSVTSGAPVTVTGPAGSATGTVVSANASTNTAVAVQSPHVTVVESIPIVLVHPDGQVTIHAVIAGVVITKVVGTGSNTSSGQAVVAASPSSASGGSPLPVLSANTSNNTVVIVQTPTITVVFEIPITITDPQGPVQIQAVIAGVVDTQLVATGINSSTGTAAAFGSPGTAIATTDGSTSSIVIVQAPQVTLDQQIPITITDPSSSVAIDAHIGSTITTTLDATAINTSSGTVITGDPAVAVTGTGGAATTQFVQTPMVSVHSGIPITITDPTGTPTVHATVADAARTAVRQALGPATTIAEPTGGDAVPAPLAGAAPGSQIHTSATTVMARLASPAPVASATSLIAAGGGAGANTPAAAPASPGIHGSATEGHAQTRAGRALPDRLVTSPLPPSLLGLAVLLLGWLARRRRRRA